MGTIIDGRYQIKKVYQRVICLQYSCAMILCQMIMRL